MIFFTSDTHWGHSNILKYCNRPFANIEEHDAELIRRWNSKVSADDEVWHLGDFAFGNQQRIPDIVAQLNGRIHFIFGNHDNRKVFKNFKCFETMQDVAEIKVGSDHVFLSHYAHRAWNHSHRGSYHLFGHTHGTLPPHERSLDAGVDCWDFYPVTLDEIKARLETV